MIGARRLSLLAFVALLGAGWAWTWRAPLALVLFLAALTLCLWAAGRFGKRER